MFASRFLGRFFLTLLILLQLNGCTAPNDYLPSSHTPQPLSPQPPRSNPPQPINPNSTQTLPVTTTQNIYRFIRTIQITPDENFSDGALGYIHYVPATDRFVVILRVQLFKPVPLTYSNDTCQVRALAYKEYTTDMQPTGNYGFLYCGFADATSQINENDIYLVSMANGPLSQNGKPEWTGWHLEKFDAVTWQRLAFVDIPLDGISEADDGPTISFINGQVVVSGEYFPDGNPSSPLGRGSHHHFFSSELKPLGKKILVPPDVPSHFPEVSMIQEPNGDILMFAASEFFTGNLIVLRFDQEWNFKEQKELRENAFFPTGSIKDGDNYYIAYTDISKKGPMLLYRNVGLAAFDSNWNMLQDVPVTDFVKTEDNCIDGESPWIQLLGDRLFVSYLESELDPVGGLLIESQAFVSIFELSR